MADVATQLAELLGKNADLFAVYGRWSDAQVMLFAGTVDDPDSFDADGGKAGALGYYPVVNVSGQTIYVPCMARLRAIALGGANAETLAAVLQSVDGKVADIDAAREQAITATEAATRVTVAAQEKVDQIGDISAAVAATGANRAATETAAGQAATSAQAFTNLFAAQDAPRWYRGKRAVAGVWDVNDRSPFVITDDGFTYAPNLVLDGGALGQVAGVVNASVPVGLFDAATGPRYTQGKLIVASIADPTDAYALAVAADGSVYAPKLVFGAAQQAQITAIVGAVVPVGLFSQQIMYAFGKRLVAAIADETLVAWAVADDGTVYAPNLVLGAAPLAVIDQRIAKAVAGVTPSPASKIPANAFEALGSAKYQPVEVVFLCGNSNFGKGGYGLIGAWTKYLVGRFNLFSTQPFKAGIYNANNPVATGGSTSREDGASATLISLAMPRMPAADGGVGAYSFGYVADGSTLPAGTSGGVILQPAAGVNIKARYRAHYCYGTFASAAGAGTFQMRVRLNGAPFTTIATGPIVNTVTGAEGRTIATLDIPADAARAVGIQAGWALPGGNPIVGPNINYWSRLENLDAVAGVTCYELYAVGGQSMRDMAQTFQTWTDAELTAFFAEVIRLPRARGFTPRIVCFLHDDLNQQNEKTVPSAGARRLDPAIAKAAAAASAGAIAAAWNALADEQAPGSVAAYLDNIAAQIKRVTDIFQMNGWPDTWLYFVIQATHPPVNFAASILPRYIAAYTEVYGLRPRVSVINTPAIIPQATIAPYYQRDDANNATPTGGFHLQTPFEYGDALNGYDFVIGKLGPLLIPDL